MEEAVQSQSKQNRCETLILQGGTEEITDLNSACDLETLKKVVKTSSEKLFNIAEKSLQENKCIERVVLLKRIFRCDKNDPNKLKAKLSEYGNRVLDDLWLDKGCPDNIVLGKQYLESNTEQIIQRFGDPDERNFDGIYLKGKQV